MTAKHLTRSLADRHERLYPRFAALAAQAGAIALRRPAAAVPQAMRAVAETLFYEMQPFLPMRRGLPAVPPDMAGLATELGQALAGLDVYEASNTASATSC